MFRPWKEIWTFEEEDLIMIYKMCTTAVNKTKWNLPVSIPVCQPEIRFASFTRSSLAILLVAGYDRFSFNQSETLKVWCIVIPGL